jgi:asparagine synthase (glutamine-hydrolysing)
MVNTDGGLQLTFDGRIYNFQALCAELESAGYVFRTRTDAELILHAYEHWGLGCLAKLRGAFAFGLWDARRRRLLLARDRIGEKPLYYGRFGGHFFFASELRALLAHPAVSREIFPPAIDAYLSYGYVPAPHTVFRGIYKLPPAQYLILDANRERSQTRVGHYWTLDGGPKLNLDEREVGDALHEKLDEAVRLRMTGGAPAGAFLSGEIESSVVVGLMARHSSQPIKTFSIGFNWQNYNELNHTRRIAEKLGTDHHELIVKPDPLELLPHLARYHGEPYADPSAVMAFYASQLVRRHVTVALNGDGGDDGFAGYELYEEASSTEQLRSVSAAAAGAQTVNRARPHLPVLASPQGRVQITQGGLQVLSRPLPQRRTGELPYFSQDERRVIYSKDFRAQLSVEAGARNLMAEATGVDARSYLLYDPPAKADGTPMGNGLEVRLPFLDHEVMELAAHLPARLKSPGKSLRHLLRSTFADWLPPDIAPRSKTGVALPVGRWFRGPMRGLLCDALLLESRSRGYFQPMQIARLVDDHLNERADHSFRLWNLLMLELWQREFVETE